MIPFLLPEPSAKAVQAGVAAQTPLLDVNALTFAEMLDGFRVAAAEENLLNVEDFVPSDTPLDVPEQSAEEPENPELTEAELSPQPEIALRDSVPLEIPAKSPTGPAADLSDSDNSTRKSAPPLASRAQTVFESNLSPIPPAEKPVFGEVERVSQRIWGAPADGPNLQKNLAVAMVPPVRKLAAKSDYNEAHLRPRGRQETIESAALLQRPVPTGAPIAVTFQHEVTAPQPIAAPAALEGLFAAPVERAAHVQSQTSHVQTSAMPAETARHAAAQIAVAVTERAGRPTEIALNPEELGRVRMTMSAVDTSLTLVVTAERQETADLLRRHIETLAQEFKDLGYSDISFSFANHGDAPDAEPERLAATGRPAIENEETAAPETVHLVATSGLDIKL
ncbi:hook-length control protein FliK [Yoonia tamlensis]|uniref:Hook-length control protein FliK n=1 Tax=Yoonia tamlensis TaxID=390270 RepID=A0A1I6HB89_9RHOB|nr:flagellar hook-length control protein FliK [Yoonia tamlensis]SFR51678.1 hook-length control protein FliK [Yoonia tamlensis]